MRMKWAVLLASILIMFLPPERVYASHTFESTYTYDYWGVVKRSLPAFELVQILDGSSLPNIRIGSIDDVAVSADRIFLVDATENRVNVFDKDLNFLISIKAIRDETGRIIVDPESGGQLMLNKPEGVFYSEALAELYIADTGAERIVVLDGHTYHHLRTIEKPEEMIGATQFKPSKLIVSKDGKLSIVVQGSYEGIIEINRDGTFSRYFGLNKPRVNLIDYFWKSLATDEQKQKMSKTFAPSFNNIAIDSEGLIYATTFDSSAQDKVFRFNAKGENVLLEHGYFPVIGDLSFGETELQSEFIDIAITDYGVYALLDRKKGQVFLYNFQGELMNIFGSAGNLKGNVKEPSAIAWFGERLIVTDKYFGAAYIYQPTEFGQAALDAEKHYFRGEWEEAGEDFATALGQNSNYDIAYTGVGRNYLMQDEVEEAMYYLELGNDRYYYSMAFEEYRNKFIQQHFVWFVLILVAFAGALFYSEYRYNKRVQ